jgi:hypothetical protein
VDWARSEAADAVPTKPKREDADVLGGRISPPVRGGGTGAHG